MALKVDKTVKKETLYIASWVGVLSLLMQAVFVIINKWNYTVLLGNLWGAVIAVGNFFIMGLFVQKAVAEEQAQAKKIIKLSHSLRSLFVIITVAAGVTISWFSTIAVIIPLIFPSIAVALRSFIKEKPGEVEEPHE